MTAAALVVPEEVLVEAEWAGRRQEALGFLRRAVEIRDPAIVAFQSPHMSSLRTAPEFRGILAGLRWELPVFAPSEVARA